MPIINRAAGMKDEIAAWRQDFHANPEILFEVHRTAGIVADIRPCRGVSETGMAGRRPVAHFQRS